MASPKHYQKRIAEIINGKLGGFGRKKHVSASFAWETIPEAKQRLSEVRVAQKHLRALKKEVNLEIKAIRAHYNAKIANTRAGLASKLILGKGNARSLAANAKQRLRNERDSAIAPYERLKLSIDTILAELDRVKFEIQMWIEQNK